MPSSCFKRTALPALLAIFTRGLRFASKASGGQQGRAIVRMADLIPRGTPLNRGAKHLSVLSYNLLAPAFVRPIDLRTGEIQPFAAFQWVSEEDLDWEKRKEKILDQLRSWSADVVCLQEVQFDCNDENSNSFTLPNWLRNLEGYTVCLPGEKYLQQIADRNERVLANRVAIGCAVLFRSDRLVFVEVPDKGEDPNTLVSACLTGHPDSELHDLGPTAFFSVHLDAQSEEKRVEQMKKCLEKARGLHTRDAVFAGDMNTECLPGSCIRAYFSSESPSADDMARECASALRISGEDEEENEAGVNTDTELTAEHMEKWKLLWDKAAQAPQEHRMDLQRVPIGPTRSSYDHGMSEGPCATWSLDHIFYSPRTLKLLARWTALEADPDSAASGLPNAENPSDHLPIAAIFEVHPTPCLLPSDRQKFLERLEKLEEEQQRELAELEDQLKALEPETEAPGPKGKKKDSPEMIAFKQEKRRKTKELKAVHLAKRKEFWGNLNDLELDLMEECCGSSWLETGVRG